MTDVNPPRSLLRRPLLLGMLVGLLIGPGLLLATSAGMTVAGTTVARAAPLLASVPPVTADPASIGTNPFIPEDANIGDCVSSVPRPQCGSDQQGGWHQYLTMLVLLLGTVFIGWRIARGVRSRDRSMTPPSDT